jgi:hypothetical protein
VAPGSTHGQGTLTNVLLEKVNIPNYGIGTDSRHGLWVRNDACGSVTIVNSKIADVQNSSTNFIIRGETISDLTRHTALSSSTPLTGQPGQEAQVSFGQVPGH